MDANVSNLSVASFPDDHPEQLVAEQICCTAEQHTTAQRAAAKARIRQKALDRSRRNTNPDQYGPSARQEQRAQRRAMKGLAARQIANPGGPRHARADGVPLRAYRRDKLSRAYQRTRADHTSASRAASQAKHGRSREVAARIVAAHGSSITVEDCLIATWARLWGRGVQQFSPGMLVTALAAECAAVGGRLYRAGTRATALSQHCLCGSRVLKTLTQRMHDCPHCGLRADRDVTSAMLACCVTFTTIRALRASITDLPTLCERGLPPSKRGRVQSTGTSHQHHQMALDRPGPAATTRWPLLSEQHSAHPRTDQACLDVAGPTENNSTPSCLAQHDPLRVNS